MSQTLSCKETILMTTKQLHQNIIEALCASIDPIYVPDLHLCLSRKDRYDNKITIQIRIERHVQA